MMHAGRSHVGRQEGFVRWIRGLAALLLFAGLLAGVGCYSKPKPTTSLTEDTTAQKITIAANFCVSPGVQPLFKGQKTRFQWHNTSSEDLLVVFKNTSGNEFFPTRLLIPAGQFSAVQQVCGDCPNGTYEYRLQHLVSGTWEEAACPSGPPTVPEVSVGD